MTTVAEALAAARAIGIDRLDAQRLLAHRLGVGRGWLLAHDEACLDARQAREFVADCHRRADDVPLAYLTGEREFHGLPLVITPAVLDPRPDTETLVDWALELLAGPLSTARTAVDLGTGSGAIALAIKRKRPHIEMHATDIDADALAVAALNAERLGTPLTLAAGHWWDAVPSQQFDLAVSNPPYVAPGDPHLAKLRHEPLRALVAERGGLQAIEAIVNGAPPHLSAGGWLLIEHGFDQADAVCRLLRDRGFDRIASRADLAQQPRCSGGRWPR